MAGEWQLDGYDVLEALARPGPGELRRARRCRDGQPVLVRRLPTSDPGVTRRLRRTAAVLGSIGGGHVLAVRDVVHAGDAIVVVSDAPARGSLADLLERRGQLRAGEVVTIVGPMAATLALAHARGLTHGGLCAHDVLFAADGRPLLADVGLREGLRDAPGDPDDDVRRLVALTVRCLGDPAVGSAAHSVVAAARAAASAEGMAAAVLAAAPAEPVDFSGAGADADADAGAEADADAAGGRRRGVVAAATAIAATAAAVLVGLSVGRPAPTDATALPAVSTGRRAVSAPSSPVPTPSALTLAPTPSALTSPVPTSTAARTWRRIVADLEEMRVRALSLRDEDLLRRAYAPHSRDLHADRRLIRGLRQNGLTAHDLVVSVRSVQPRSRSVRHAVLRVVDVMSGYELRNDDATVVVAHRPRRSRTWLWTLVRTRRGWRILDVRPARPVSR